MVSRRAAGIADIRWEECYHRLVMKTHRMVRKHTVTLSDKSSYLSYQTANGFEDVSLASAEVCKSLKEMLEVSDIAYES